MNPRLSPRALAMVYNPLDEALRRTVTLPLASAGASGSVTIREQDGEPRSFALDPGVRARVPVEIAPRGLTWLVVE
ncbi:MAG: hypothetical protein ACUVYA_06885 [Planctomycetota bacterium]